VVKKPEEGGWRASSFWPTRMRQLGINGMTFVQTGNNAKWRSRSAGR